MKGNLWILSILVVALTVAAVAIPAAVTSNAEPVHAEENQTLDKNGTQLDQASDAVVIYENETVTVGNETLTRGEEYTLDYESGILAANSSEYNGTDVLVDYTVSQPADGRTGEIAALLGLLNPIWPLLVVAAAFATLLGLISWVW